MATDDVEQLMRALAGLQADVEWLKRGMFALFGLVGVVLVKLLV